MIDVGNPPDVRQ